MTTAWHPRTADILDRDAAIELAKQQGIVCLDVRSLDLAAAKALTQFQGEQLCFDADPLRLDAACAQQLLKLGEKGQLRLEWLRDHACGLDRSTFLALAAYADSIGIQDFGTLEISEAEALSQCKGTQLLVYLDELDEPAAKHLAMAQMGLLMVSVPRLSAPVAAALGSSAAWDVLQVFIEDGSLDVESASALSQYRGSELDVSVKAPLSPEAMRELAKFPGLLFLTLPEIGRAAAAELADSEGAATLAIGGDPDADVLAILSSGRREVTYFD